MRLRSIRLGSTDYTIVSAVIAVLCVFILAAGTVSLFIVDDASSLSTIAFQMFETVLMMVVIFIPTFINRKTGFEVPVFMESMFVAFCFCSLILGDVADFYGKFEWWDSLQHGISGILLGILGFSIINIFNRKEYGGLRFPPIFVSIWMVFFAMSLGAIWEIAEFIIDGMLGINTQQYLAGSGTFDNTDPLVGHDALRDTMEDLMLDLAGSLLIAMAGYFELKKQNKKQLTQCG